MAVWRPKEDRSLNLATVIKKLLGYPYRLANIKIEADSAQSRLLRR